MTGWKCPSGKTELRKVFGIKLTIIMFDTCNSGVLWNDNGNVILRPASLQYFYNSFFGVPDESKMM